MILKETILSAFTERGTLLKWLKKVEAALNNAVLTDISVEQVSATQVKLKFTFENGDFVESPVLTLPRGEKGEPGKDGAPGKDGLDGEGIAATIEVGTVTTGAAGTNASVTNVGTEQRAILNFVIPRGDTGASGAEGSAGVGFDDATRIEQNSGANTLTAGTNGLTIAATFKVTAGDEVFEIPSSMFLAVKGSESIVIDVDESGTFFDIHLDADIVTKLSRVLVTPMSAPASVSLVAVDTSNVQTMLTLGDGLSVSGGVLSASGGGGSSGLKLYLHKLSFSNAANSCCAVSPSSAPITMNAPNPPFEDNYYGDFPYFCFITGQVAAGAEGGKIVFYIEYNMENIVIHCFNIFNRKFETITITDVSTFLGDTVTEVTV